MAMRQIKEAVYRVTGRFMQVRPFYFLIDGFFKRRASIIFYHGIWRRDQPHFQLFGGLDLKVFAKEMESLCRIFRFVNINDLLNADGDIKTNKPLMCLTFDDGFDLIRSGAVDVMDRLGISAAVFVNTACLENKHLMWQHAIQAIRSTRGDAEFVVKLNETRLGKENSPAPIVNARQQLSLTKQWPSSQKDRLTAQFWQDCGMPDVDDFLTKHRPYMNCEDLSEWLTRGHVVGFHTHTHPFCSTLNRQEMEIEICESALKLQKAMVLEQMPFAYPFGNRLQPELETELAGRNIFNCLLGTAGYSELSTDPNGLDRVEAENGIDAEVFGRPILTAMKRRLRGSKYSHR